MTHDLYSLLSAVGITPLPAHKNLQIEQISCDSRAIGEGGLFFGLLGENVDGGCFWPDAMRAGAVAAVIGENAAELFPPGDEDAVLIVSEPVGYWMGEIASIFWGEPSLKMKLIGVTGTNGKTTTTYLIEHLISKVGMSSALFGTLFNRWPGHSESANHTTPFGDILQMQLATAVASGASFGVMEVSSHALDQRRVAGCNFSGAVFTNLSQDHLDYHNSMESYFGAKALLFKEPLLKADHPCSVVNIDDPWGERLSKELEGICWRASLDKKNIEDHHPELFITDFSMNPKGMSGTLHSPHGEGYFESTLIGKFNLMNLLEAVGILIQQGLPLGEVLTHVNTFPGVPGRMERITLKGVPDVIVDYAHTPDGLENALATLRVCTTGKLYCVFGCGGDRDREKRPKMGCIASKFADYLIITSDNPRTEHPQRIINDIVRGIPKNIDLTIELNRDIAIKMAIDSASSDDMVLIAGKGHEDYQIIGTDKIQFDDREMVRKALYSKLSN